MTNNLFKKTTNKKFLIVVSCVMALIVVASIVFSFVLGFNYAPTLDDRTTLTVTVDDYYFYSNLDSVKEVCEEAFDGAKVEYTYEGVMSGESELLYVFDKDVNVTELEESVRKAVETQMQAGGKLAEATEISVTSNLESNEPELPFAYGYRAIGAVALFALLAFVYVAIRFKLNMGIATAVNLLVSAFLATSLLLVTRIPVTGSTIYAIAVSVLLSAIFTVFTLSKLRANLKEDGAAEKTAEDLVVDSIATKEITLTAGTLGVALILVGAIATSVTRWFAITSLVCLVASAFVSLFFLPALYLPMLRAELKKSAESSKSGYIGAKKGFLQKKKEESVEEKTEEVAE
ncbi:MAG: hypothetical protein E7381_00375 [Clostridiales bacterium]|nr:hypothetical protein [Clostridiales bacterium]